MKSDIVIVGTGAAGLFCALNLPRNKKIILVTKAGVTESDSFLAQGGICVLRDQNDYKSYFEDTMRAGHYENNRQSVDIMLRSSPGIIDDLISCGVEFAKQGDSLIYTKEGAHSAARILFHEDITGEEITSKLLACVRGLENAEIIENFTVVDIVEQDGRCVGVIGRDRFGKYETIMAGYTVFATGGIGGLYSSSTNYRHLTGDAIAIALRHRIRLENIDYIQIHPTTLYSPGNGRRFLISESVRGEGAVLLNAAGERFVDELQPRDVVTDAIYRQMEIDRKPYVWLSMVPIPEDVIRNHFPHICQRCLEEGYDVTREWIPVVPAQHYFMGGIWVDSVSKTSMDRLYAVGETSCNGVHGRNRLASNSLLESLVFAKRAAQNISSISEGNNDIIEETHDNRKYDHCEAEYRRSVLHAIERMKEAHGLDNNEARCR